MSFYGLRRQRRFPTPEGVRLASEPSSASTSDIIRPRSPFYRSLRPRHSSLIAGTPHENGAPLEKRQKDLDDGAPGGRRRRRRRDEVVKSVGRLKIIQGSSLRADALAAKTTCFQSRYLLDPGDPDTICPRLCFMNRVSYTTRVSMNWVTGTLIPLGGGGEFSVRVWRTFLEIRFDSWYILKAQAIEGLLF